MKYRGIWLEATRDLYSRHLLLRCRRGGGRVDMVPADLLSTGVASAYLTWFTTIGRDDLASELIEVRQGAGIPDHQLVDLRAVEARHHA